MEDGSGPFVMENGSASGQARDVLPLSQLSSEDDCSSWENPAFSSKIRVLFWLCGLVFGSIQAFSLRFYMNVDGISYLDLAHAYLNSDWKSAVNGYWSPLYSWLLAAAIYLSHLSLFWESSVTHAVNLAVLAASMAAFDLFLRELCRLHRAPTEIGGPVRPLPFWVMQALGYALFLYAALVWISVGIVTPDQCVAMTMYLTAAILLYIRAQKPASIWYVVLGIVWGLGYLAKAVLFPLGCVSLAMTPFLVKGEKYKNRLLGAILSIGVFALVASPLVITLSHAKRRFTFGDSGKLNYIGHVDRPQFSIWQGEGNFGVPKHAPRKVWSDPSVYEFATPVGGTYPLWYDTTYWEDGMKAHFDLGGQLHALIDGFHAYVDCILEQSGFVAVLIVFYALDRNSYCYWRTVASAWPASAAAIFGLGLYALVFVETRYIASFLVILGLCLLAGIRLKPSARAPRILRGAVAAVALLTFVILARNTALDLYGSLRSPQHVQWNVAQAIAEQGIRPGDRIATIIDHHPGDYWAHLAGLKIVEEIPFDEMPRLAEIDQKTWEQLIVLFRESNVKAIVTRPAPPVGTRFAWQSIQGTDYFVYVLPK